MKKMILFLFFVAISQSQAAQMKFGELSVRGNYSKTNFGPDAFSTSKRYTFSAGVNITPVTEIEATYSDANDYYKNSSIQTVTTREQTLSGTLMQTLVPPSWMFQPYVKGGAAQYNRRQNGQVYGIPTAEIYTKSPSFVMGGGFRLYFSENFSFRLEVVSYLPNFKPSEAKNNVNVEGGFSWQY